MKLSKKCMVTATASGTEGREFESPPVRNILGLNTVGKAVILTGPIGQKKPITTTTYVLVSGQYSSGNYFIESIPSWEWRPHAGVGFQKKKFRMVKIFD
jgi:hypothetical protein